MRGCLVRIFILFSLLPVQLGASPLKGCLTGPQIASAATKLAQANWNTTSLARLRTIWPTELGCQTEACDSVWSMDRIISGQWECGATFAFHIHQSGPTRIEQLDEVVLNYSAPTKNQLINIAKRIAKAIGVKQSDLTIVGKSDDQHFDWITTMGNHRELSAIELRFGHRGQVWHLFLNWGRSIL